MRLLRRPEFQNISNLCPAKHYTLGQDKGDIMRGIIESDETFFEASEKGNRHLESPGRKRGLSSISGKEDISHSIEVTLPDKV